MRNVNQWHPGMIPSKYIAKSSSVGSSVLRLLTSFARELSTQPKSGKKRLDVAIVGAPNAGKSQLLNVLVQSPVAAVSRKRHTTRSGLLGARTIDDTQLLFIDTPGFLKMETAKQEGLFKELVKVASREVDQADYTLVVIDAARKLDEHLKEALVYLMLRAHHSLGRQDDFLEQEETEIVRDKFAIVLNKIDLVHPKDKLLDLATELGDLAEACVRYRWHPTEDTENDDHPVDQSMTRRVSYRDVPKVLSETAINHYTPNISDAKVNHSLLSTSNWTEDELLEFAAQYPPIFYISALKEDGVDDIVNHLLDLATPCETWVIPQREDEDGVIDDYPTPTNPETKRLHTHPPVVTNMSYAERVQEIIREKLFRCLHQEVPFAVTQVNRVFRFIPLEATRDETAVRIDQDLIVRTKSHYNLVMGRSGSTLKRIQEASKIDVKRIMPEGCKDVILNLHVKLSRSRN